MSGMLAIETATDACSVAMSVGDSVLERHEVVPRQHHHRLFRMLEDILPDAQPQSRGVGAVAYGCGPGSFTGLRIAAAAAQGIAFACGLPAIGVSTLAVLAQTALRTGVVGAADTILATLDARMNEVYAGVFVYEEGLAVLRHGPWACAPADLQAQATSLHAIGSGAHYVDRYPVALRRCIAQTAADLLPRARDMLPLAARLQRQGRIQRPGEVRPIYVRDEISWKKLHEQGAGT